MRGTSPGVTNRSRAMLFMEGWKECRRCKLFYKTGARFCKDCGQTLATTPKTGKGKRNLLQLRGIKRY